ncbi:MAG: extracellular solute-binding protein, partial [Chloroflexota bacterium]
IGQCCATLPTWASKGILTNLDPLIKRDWKASLVNDFSKIQYDYFSSKEAGRFAVPMYMGTSALYYNKDSFQKAGVAFPDDTWDMSKWADAMRRLTAPSQERWGMYLRVSRGTRNFLVNGGGGNIVDPKDDTKAAFDQKPALDVFQWIRDRIWQDNSAIQRPQESGSSAVMLARGRIGMLIDGSFTLTTIINETKDGTNWDLALIPKGFKERRNRATVDGWVIWKEAKNKEESFALMGFLQSDEWWDINMPITGQQPTRLSLQAKYPTVLRNTSASLANKNLNVFTHPAVNNYMGPQENWRLDDEAAKIYEAAWTTAVIDNKASVTDTFKQAAREIANLHKQAAAK